MNTFVYKKYRRRYCCTLAPQSNVFLLNGRKTSVCALFYSPLLLKGVTLHFALIKHPNYTHLQPNWFQQQVYPRFCSWNSTGETYQISWDMCPFLCSYHVHPHARKMFTLFQHSVVLLDYVILSLLNCSNQVLQHSQQLQLRQLQCKYLSCESCSTWSCLHIFGHQSLSFAEPVIPEGYDYTSRQP